MSHQSLSNTEKDLHFFITRFYVGDIIQTAHIQEVDMSGWMLFECFLAPAQTVIYIGWDEEANTPEWIDLEEDVLQEYIPHLTNAIYHFKKRANAA